MAKYDKWITEEGLLLIGGWARSGLTDKDIAKNMKISRSTLSEWKNKFSELADTLKMEKDVADYKVENSLYKRANGYEYKEVTKEAKWNPKEEKYEMIVTKEVTKQVAPDTTAQIFWLKNRQPQNWREKVVVDNNDIDSINKHLQNIANLINNPKKVRTEDSINE